MAASVSAKTVRAVLGVARSVGLDPAALARAHHVEEALTDVDARFPHRAWLALWEEVDRAGGGAPIGLRAAEALPWGHWDVIDYLLATSDTLGTALLRFARYFALISTGVTIAVEPRGDVVRVVRRHAAGARVRLLAPAEFAFAATLSHLRMAVGFELRPREVRFVAPPPRSVAEHRRFFGCPVAFEADEDAIVLDRHALALPMRGADAQLGSILERHARAIASSIEPADAPFVDQVRRAISASLLDGDLSIGSTARRLGTSVRTLQRRLRDAQTSYDEVLDGTRRELALRYLDDPSLSIRETAHLLAYGDVRGFYRAFARWEGRTPAAFRRRHRASAAGGASRP